MDNNARASIEQLIHGISHDMGAPLRAVVQFSDLLQQRLADKLDDKERYWFELIYQNGRSAQHMLAALLTYSRLTQQFEQQSQFKLQAQLQTALADLAVLVQQTGAKIEISGELAPITGCAPLWHRFFSYVVENALRFQPKSIDAEHDPASASPAPNVVISFSQSDTTTMINIEDNGIGVAEKYRTQLTTPFKRLNGDEYPGLGMGLCYCERIVQLHGGTLEFSVSSMQGLRVTCCIPNTFKQDI